MAHRQTYSHDGSQTELYARREDRIESAIFDGFGQQEILKDSSSHESKASRLLCVVGKSRSDRNVLCRQMDLLNLPSPLMMLVPRVIAMTTRYRRSLRYPANASSNQSFGGDFSVGLLKPFLPRLAYFFNPQRRISCSQHSSLSNLLKLNLGNREWIRAISNLPHFRTWHLGGDV